MTNRYYTNEYTAAGWKLLIDEALYLGCEIKYNNYGTICTIDSTPVEDRVIKEESHRHSWAEHIHNLLHDVGQENARPLHMYQE